MEEISDQVKISELNVIDKKSLKAKFNWKSLFQKIVDVDKINESIDENQDMQDLSDLDVLYTETQENNKLSLADLVLSNPKIKPAAFN